VLLSYGITITYNGVQWRCNALQWEQHATIYFVRLLWNFRRFLMISMSEVTSRTQFPLNIREGVRSCWFPMGSCRRDNSFCWNSDRTWRCPSVLLHIETAPSRWSRKILLDRGFKHCGNIWRVCPCALGDVRPIHFLVYSFQMDDFLSRVADWKSKPEYLKHFIPLLSYRMSGR